MSFLGKIFSYVRQLEERSSQFTDSLQARVKFLEERETALLDRIMRLTTGYDLHQAMPDAAEIAKLEKDLNSAPRTVMDLAAEKEAASARLYQQMLRVRADGAEHAEEVSLEGTTNGNGDSPA